MKNRYIDKTIRPRIIRDRGINIDPAEIGGALLSGVAHPSDSVGRLFPPRSLFLFFFHTRGTNNCARAHREKHPRARAKWRSLVKATSFPRPSFLFNYPPTFDGGIRLSTVALSLSLSPDRDGLFRGDKFTPNQRRRRRRLLARAPHTRRYQNFIGHAPNANGTNSNF